MIISIFILVFKKTLLTNSILRIIFDAFYGAVAQLGERLNGIQEARSSILLSSTSGPLMERPFYFAPTTTFFPFFLNRLKMCSAVPFP